MDRGQEEIVGFVVIVILVSIAILIFLVIFLRHGENQPVQSSQDVNQYLSSLVEMTTSCAVSFEPAYDNLGKLLSDCHDGGVCTSGVNACDALNSTLRNVLAESWKVGPDRPIKGYEFVANYNVTASGKLSQIIEVNSGNCTGGVVRGGVLPPLSGFSGVIEGTLKLCYGSGIKS